MPAYHWECRACGQQAEVICSISEFNKLPATEDLQPKTAIRKCPLVEHQWERTILDIQPFVRGPNWGLGRKGHWALFIGLIGYSLLLPYM